MTSLSEIKIPTSETVSKDVPDPTRDDIPLPADLNTVLLTGLFVLAVLTTAYFAAEIILPIVLAGVLNLLLQPGVRLLGRIYIPKSIAALLLIVSVLGVLFAIGAAVSGPAHDWFARLPEGVPHMMERLQFLKEPFETASNFLHKADSLGQTQPSAGQSLGITASLFRGTQHFASGLFEMMLILFFLLVSGDVFLRRLVEILPNFKDKRQVVEISQQVEKNVSAYLVTITVMNATVGVATAVIMWVCGVGDPILWGVVAFLLNFVPIMGPLVGVILFLFAGFLAIPTLWLSFLPAGLYFLVHVIEGETVTPILLARRFTLNPVLVIISLIFWFWMWGVLGAILSVPMLAITKIICDGIKPLNAVGHFLAGESEQS